MTEYEAIIDAIDNFRFYKLESLVKSGVDLNYYSRHNNGNFNILSQVVYTKFTEPTDAKMIDFLVNLGAKFDESVLADLEFAIKVDEALLEIAKIKLECFSPLLGDLPYPPGVSYDACEKHYLEKREQLIEQLIREKFQEDDREVILSHLCTETTSQYNHDNQVEYFNQLKETIKAAEKRLNDSESAITFVRKVLIGEASPQDSEVFVKRTSMDVVDEEMDVVDEEHAFAGSEPLASTPHAQEPAREIMVSADLVSTEAVSLLASSVSCSSSHEMHACGPVSAGSTSLSSGFFQREAAKRNNLHLSEDLIDNRPSKKSKP